MTRDTNGPAQEVGGGGGGKGGEYSFWMTDPATGFIRRFLSEVYQGPAASGNEQVLTFGGWVERELTGRWKLWLSLCST